MSKSSSRIHIERSEFLVICGIVFLFAGLMFSLGVMVGVGIGPSSETTVAESEGNDDSHDNAHGASKGHSEKGEVSRKVASHNSPSKKSAHGKKSDEIVPGRKLKENFKKAKQADFEEMLAVEVNGEAGPASVMDSQAYFDSREAKRDEERDLPLDTNFSGMIDERKPASVTKSKVTPPVVKSLFERKPAGANDYSPVYGEYTVLVASYSSEDEAVSKLGALRVAGFDDAYFKKEKSKNIEGEWYRVAVGSYKDLKWALRTKETLRKKSLAVTPIVRKVE